MQAVLPIEPHPSQTDVPVNSHAPQSAALTFEALRAAIPAACYQRSVVKGVGFICLVFMVYGATSYLLYTAESLWALAVFAAIRGLTIGPTFIVGHDACHDALTPSPTWNRVLGQIAFLPSWHSFTAWRYRHNFIHHRHTQVLEMDNGYPPASAVQFALMSTWQRLIYRRSRSIPFAGLLYFPEWLHHHPLASAADRADYQKAGKYFALDYLLVLVWVVCEVALFAGVFAHFGLVSASHFHPALMVFFGIFVTQFFWNWQMGVVTFLHHFHPDVVWYSEDAAPGGAERQLRSTIHTSFPLGTNWIMRNILEHTAHHIVPQIPLYHLPAAQAALREAYAKELKSEPLSLATVWRTFSVCKLWDPVAKRWAQYPARSGS